MSQSRGYKILNQNGLYFLTLTVVGWVDLFSRFKCKQIIIESLNYCQKNKGLHVCAYVIMSSHIHLICYADKNSQGLSIILRDFKSFTSKQLINWSLTSNEESRKDWLEVVFKYYAKFNSNNKTYQLWQQNNYPKELLNPKFTRQKLDYIHLNPVTAGIVKEAKHYVYSSASFYAGMTDSLLEVEIIHFGSEDGFVYT